MSLTTQCKTHDLVLTGRQRQRVEHHLERLAKRLAQRPAPHAKLLITRHAAPRTIQVDLQVELGRLGSSLISHQSGDTVEQAVRRAVADAERQLERLQAAQRAEHTFGVPSRRLPRSLRPARAEAETRHATGAAPTRHADERGGR
jgi:ribosome-associated translation inhibitor RaiA